MSFSENNDFLPNETLDYYYSGEDGGEVYPGFDMSILANLTDEEYMEVVSRVLD